ncbi:hypothetical protein CLAFUW4_08969 [Fulvia fulva]|nr:hypothetical protein CLAFUR4_08975 [Fulvia fulva]KAK4614978.1 hypothetical protein CLAFUR0_08967 [Fulvia fulva]WPV20136.1 hypothetical protein CLAFUW4_08969 [Fulvia fulva]WPV35227.1 hypothetical protein CLAFUW7_08970 [Fulvia fulva]
MINDTVVKQAPEMAAAKSRTGFMSLSAELRNRIYELALISTEVDSNLIDPRNRHGNDGPETFYNHPGICIQHCAIPSYAECAYQTYWGWRSHLRQQPPITRVSRQIRSETLPMFYGMNEFLVYNGTGYGGIDFTEAFESLKAIGKRNAGHIKSLTVLMVDYMADYECEDVSRMFEKHGVCKEAVLVCVNTADQQSAGEFEPCVHEAEDDEDDEDAEDASTPLVFSVAPSSALRQDQTSQDLTTEGMKRE